MSNLPAELNVGACQQSFRQRGRQKLFKNRRVFATLGCLSEIRASVLLQHGPRSVMRLFASHGQTLFASVGCRRRAPRVAGLSEALLQCPAYRFGYMGRHTGFVPRQVVITFGHADAGCGARYGCRC